MLINIPLYVIHHNPEYWPDPELFKPERCFTDQHHDIDIHFIVELQLVQVPQRECGQDCSLLMASIWRRTSRLHWYHFHPSFSLGVLGLMSHDM